MDLFIWKLFCVCLKNWNSVQAFEILRTLNFRPLVWISGKHNLGHICHLLVPFSFVYNSCLLLLQSFPSVLFHIESLGSVFGLERNIWPTCVTDGMEICPWHWRWWTLREPGRLEERPAEFLLPHAGRGDKPNWLLPASLWCWKNTLIVLCLSVGKGKTSLYHSCQPDSILERWNIEETWLVCINEQMFPPIPLHLLLKSIPSWNGLK